MKKNIFFNITILLIILTCITPTFVIADDIDTSNETMNITNEIEQNNLQEVSASSVKELQINSRSYVVLDRKTGQILLSKNENEKRKMASTTKIMTAILILEKGNLQDIVTVSKKAAGTGGSRLGLKTNDTIKVEDLLYGLLLCSGNDSAVCLAEYLSGSVEEFANLMNQKALELELNQTHFVTPHGLDSEEHYTTSYELAILSNYALNNEKFKEIVETKNYTVTINGFPKTLSNTNELLGNLNGVYGIKTGFTNGANRCLVTACQRNNMDIICVVLGADTKKFRTQDSIKLIEYTFQNYEYVNIENKIQTEFEQWKRENLNYFSVEKGICNNIDLYYSPLTYSSFPVLKDKISTLKINFECNFHLIAPIEQNTSIGKIKVICDNEELMSCSLLISQSIKKKNSFFYLFYFLKNYPFLLKT